MLRAFCTIRTALKQSEFLRNPRHITGQITVTIAHLEQLAPLQQNGHIESSSRDGKSLSHFPDAVGHVLHVTLNPRTLHYYEDFLDLVSYTAEEPSTYYVHGIGEIIGEANEGQTDHASIQSYRQILRTRKLLRMTADFEKNAGNVVFLTPEKLEIPLVYSSADLPQLDHLAELQRQFEKRPEKDPADYDQRLVLFRKALREYLKAYPPEERFKMFLKNFSTIYDSYNRDYQLWVGNTFGELEKSFEEKRLKFVSDLNGILAGVQASILAVPVTAILLADKYDLANPLKDFLLAIGILAVGAIAFRLLQNQETTLDATRGAIDATKEDFEKKHTRRKEEFETRLQNLDTQEQRVRGLLTFIRNTIIVIIIAGFVGWFIALYESLNPLNSTRGTPAPTALTNSMPQQINP